MQKGERATITRDWCPIGGKHRREVAVSPSIPDSRPDSVCYSTQAQLGIEESLDLSAADRDHSIVPELAASLHEATRRPALDQPVLRFRP